VCHLISHFGPFGESVSFGARLVHGLCLIHHTLRNHVGRNRYSPLKRLKWKLGSVYLEIVLILMQDSCIVCMECTLRSEINLDASDRTSGWRVSYVILLWSIWRKCQYRCKIGARFAPNVPQAKKLFRTHPMVLLGEVAQVKAQFSPFGDSATLDAK
jgi:hypothetical protein